MRRGKGSLDLLLVLLVTFVALAPTASVGADAPAGQTTWAVHTTLVPTWFDPAETIQQTPFLTPASSSATCRSVLGAKRC